MGKSSVEALERLCKDSDLDAQTVDIRTLREKCSPEALEEWAKVLEAEMVEMSPAPHNIDEVQRTRPIVDGTVYAWEIGQADERCFTAERAYEDVVCFEDGSTCSAAGYWIVFEKEYFDEEDYQEGECLWSTYHRFPTHVVAIAFIKERLLARRRLGRRRLVWTDNERAWVVSMLQHGATKTEMARHYEVSVGRISYLLRNEWISYRSPKRPKVKLYLVGRATP